MKNGSHTKFCMGPLSPVNPFCLRRGRSRTGRRAVAGCLALAALLTLSAGAAHGQAVDPPSILLFMADDMTYSDAGALGNPAVHTPNLDRLAAAGSTFTHVFTATAMCSPTRHMLYNGQYPVRSGAYPNHARANEGTRSVAHYLASLGYRVGLAGKSHVAPQSVYPFERIGNRLEYDLIEEFIRRDPSRPFALFVASGEPHLPWNRGDRSRYDAASLALPPYFVDTPETREALTRYYAEITYMDDQLGRLLDLLDRHGQTESTLTMFYTEQGNGRTACKVDAV